ncbi:LRR receptor-like serine/threonine-protein kinase HSL2 [Quercus suber]|uniref:LRR receptor-like serine/threonine-protein kinase HSL2 n=1 Tax=Quercus suber TaxID=58331 RepID=UPI0032DED630
MVCTRPDIAHVVGVMSRFMSRPGKQHWEAVKWILRYLKGSSDTCLYFIGASLKLQGYVNTDFTGDIDSRKSTTGFVFTLGGTTLSWASNPQKIVTLSTTEAKYVATIEAGKEMIWLHGFLDELGKKQEMGIIHSDSQNTLQNLSLANNTLNGIITSRAFSRCSHLHFLSLANNYFSRKLPDFSLGITNLENLDLSNNFFTGKILASFGWWFLALRFLHLRSNDIIDSIPSFLGNLHVLTLLELISNPLMPSPLPLEIGNLTKLEIMYFSSLNLIGTILDSIGKLATLKNLDLSNNSLSGEIPESIGGLKIIKQIELYQNNLSSGLPETIANLRTLLRLDISENNLSTLSEKIVVMPLNFLNLNDNFFEGQVPEVLASNPILHELKIFNNSFSRQLPKNLGKNSDLVNIDVSTNKFTGELPMYLCYKKKLERLVTFKNSFSGTIPMLYSECDSLNYVRIEQNELSGEVPEGFWSHSRLTCLQMYSNRLQGSISHNISLASELVAISIARNNFTREIPVEICQLQQLVVFFLSQNHFFGVLPTCITGLKKLQKVLVQENMLSSKIPRNVSSLNWKALSYFNLSGNKFSSTIPPDLGTLPVLKYLDLSGNLLTGEIPESLMKLKLTEFNLSNNNLDGRVPLEFDTEFYLPSLLDNPNLCSSTLKPLALCLRPRIASSYSILVLLGFCVIILVLSLVWLYKTKFPPFGDPKPNSIAK